MTYPILKGPFLKGLFLSCVLLIAVAAPAQDVPKPFATAPSESKIILRMDFRAMEQMQSLAPLVNMIRQQEPQLSQFRFVDEADGSAETYGNLMITELAAVDPEAFGSQQEQIWSAVANGTAYGVFDLPKLQEKFSQSTQSQEHAGMSIYFVDEANAWFAMPNEWTMLIGQSAENVINAYQAGTAEGTSKWQAPGSLGEMLAASQGAPLFFGVELNEEMRQELRAGVEDALANPVAQADMQLPEASMQALAELRSGVFALREGRAGLQIEVGMGFPDASTAGAFAGGVNETIDESIASIQQDPAANQQMAIDRKSVV